MMHTKKYILYLKKEITKINKLQKNASWLYHSPMLKIHFVLFSVLLEVRTEHFYVVSCRSSVRYGSVEMIHGHTTGTFDWPLEWPRPLLCI